MPSRNVSYCNQQITVDSISAFEKLIEAYGKIADMLPRLDRLGNALVNDHNFQNVLALVYSDIIEFHRRAYKFVRRKCELSSRIMLRCSHEL
jgi:hypothetical protein